MPACDEGAAPASAWPRAARGHLRTREEGCRLAQREKPQRVHGRGQELGISERGKEDAGLRAENSPSGGATAGSNLRGGEERKGMPAGAEGAAPERARPCLH